MVEIKQALKDRYSHLHPLLFQRSVEKAKDDVELFDILDSVPGEFPLVWNENDRRWIHTEDILQSSLQLEGLDQLNKERIP